MSNSDKLALLGGTPVNDTPFRFNNSIGEEEKRAVMRVLDSGELSGFIAAPDDTFWGGPEVRALEKSFCEHFGVGHAIAMNSATSCLYGAVAALGAGPGDEVITSPYTMSATSAAILAAGATPVFADIEEEYFGLDPESVTANISPQTKGILTVNLFGHGSRLDELRAIADKHGLFLAEDNAQAPDAIYRGEKTGTVGDAGVFSFNRHKVMQSGEGGVLVTDDDTIALKAALIRNHGECVVQDMGVEDIVNTVGLNLRITEMEAAVAHEQFKKMPKLNNERIQLANRLTDLLNEIPGIIPPQRAPDSRHVYYMFASRYDETETGIPRELFAKAVTAEGCFVRAGFLRPTHLEPVFQQKICFGDSGFPFSANPRFDELDYRQGICPVCEDLQENRLLMTAIMQPPQTESDMGLFADACEKVLRNRDALLDTSREDAAAQ
ncbi:MAG TPA: hypothetical protein DCS82_08475 [Rhodospirillaceae bacterium]|nr:hypothetical protein [Rhodospirillaceae bacterium]HAT35737.1 hypothetical protein [Rhodospirillaceae bacterium]